MLSLQCAGPARFQMQRPEAGTALLLAFSLSSSTPFRRSACCLRSVFPLPEKRLRKLHRRFDRIIHVIIPERPGSSQRAHLFYIFQHAPGGLHSFPVIQAVNRVRIRNSFDPEIDYVLPVPYDPHFRQGLIYLFCKRAGFRPDAVILFAGYLDVNPKLFRRR